MEIDSSWTARISLSDGSFPQIADKNIDDYEACDSCKHRFYCNVNDTGEDIKKLVSCIILDKNNEIIFSGETILKCGKYEIRDNLR